MEILEALLEPLAEALLEALLLALVVLQQKVLLERCWRPAYLARRC